MTRLNQPTAGELEILDLLWERKRASVREIFGEIAKRRDVAYTTVLKMMQIMQEKGLVTREVSGKAHIYKPRSSKRHTQSGLVTNLLDRAFRGSALSLVQHVLETKPASAEDLAAIRLMIDEAAKRAGGKR